MFKASQYSDESDQGRLIAMRSRINAMYGDIPNMLVDRPDLQKVCFQHLKAAEEALEKGDILDCRMALADIDVEMTVSKRDQFATKLTTLVVYAALGLGLLSQIYRPTAENLLNIADDTHVIASVPREIWLWALLGSVCAMLLRVSNYNFKDRQEAKRWVISRPIIGMVMGVMIYMMSKIGMIIVEAPSDNAKQEMIFYVLAFLGGFSDSLSITMLNKLQTKLSGSGPVETGDDGDKGAKKTPPAPAPTPTPAPVPGPSPAATEPPAQPRPDPAAAKPAGQPIDMAQLAELVRQAFAENSEATAKPTPPQPATSQPATPQNSGTSDPPRLWPVQSGGAA